jgi:PilZ domain-containing protein
MSEMAQNAIEEDFVEQTHEVRIIVRIPGRFSLASRRDNRGNRRKFACRAVNISQTSMMLATPVVGPIGERVIAYFEEFGKIQGPVIRVLDGGFIMRILANNDERSKLLRKLIWLEQNKNYDVPDVRTYRRIIPEDPISTLIFPDGNVLGCFVIDMSGSGVAVSADVMPPLGTVVAVGKVTGKVVRHFDEGFAIKFKQPQSPNLLEQLVIHRW